MLAAAPSQTRPATRKHFRRWAAGSTSRSTIPDAYTQVRIHTLAISGGEIHQHDIALWRIELLDGDAVAALGAPTNLSVSGDKNSCSLTWFAPAEDGGSAIIGYTIARQTPSESGGTILVSDTGSTSTSYTDSEIVTESGTYFYWVAAITALEPDGTYSSPASIIVSIAAPGVPTSVSLTAVDEDTLQLTWSAPTTGDAPTSYQAQYREGTSGPWIDISGDVTSPHDIDGLDPDTLYQAQVRATNSGGLFGLLVTGQRYDRGGW